MIFSPTELEGVWLVDSEPHIDSRGSFSRIWCRREFEGKGLASALVQCSMSFTHRRGTIRGLHWQEPPHGEDKLVRCTRGAIWDVAVDLRSGSPTYLRYLGIRLDAKNGRALYIPRGLAHGFQTLEDRTEVLYQMSSFYEPEAGRGARWDDPAFDIRWPIPDPTLNRRDESYPDFQGVA